MTQASTRRKRYTQTETEIGQVRKREKTTGRPQRQRQLNSFIQGAPNTPLSQPCIMSSGILAPLIQMWPPLLRLETSLDSGHNTVIAHYFLINGERKQWLDLGLLAFPRYEHVNTCRPFMNNELLDVEWLSPMCRI